ncbi:hypothetical protein FJTKL_11271 [Diaporthe vaccinii]|uniref:Uncharacterized protein n=1 Tax=Diaporthe vaccinii TaxID=105482 RepID=A0ABR4EH86_9PEZI
MQQPSYTRQIPCPSRSKLTEAHLSPSAVQFHPSISTLQPPFHISQLQPNSVPSFPGPRSDLPCCVTPTSLHHSLTTPGPYQQGCARLLPGTS